MEGHQASSSSLGTGIYIITTTTRSDGRGGGGVVARRQKNDQTLNNNTRVGFYVWRAHARSLVASANVSMVLQVGPRRRRAAGEKLVCWANWSLLNVRTPRILCPPIWYYICRGVSQSVSKYSNWHRTTDDTPVETLSSSPIRSNW